MKFLAVAFCALLLAAPASAQTGTPVLSLEKAIVPSEPVPAGGSTEAVLDLAFQCPNQSEVQPDDWVITVEVSPPEGFHADASQPDPIPGETCLTEPRVSFTLTLSMHVPTDAEPAMQHTVKVAVQAVPDGDSPLSSPSSVMRTGLTLSVAGEPRDADNGTIEPVADVEENTPGPALPLLLGLLAAVASVRRRR